MNISFLEAARGCSNISFIPVDMDTGEKGCPTRYGRNCFNTYVIIEANIRDYTKIIHPPIMLNQECYNTFSEYNISTND
jgi:hypothetical protein